jgi:hypothetical protein
VVAQLGAVDAVSEGFTPFVVSGVVKAVLAALAPPGRVVAGAQGRPAELIPAVRASLGRQGAHVLQSTH